MQRVWLGLVTVTALALAGSPAGAAPISGPRSIGSFYSADDGASHAIIARSNGDVVEAYWWDHTGASSSTIAHFDDIAAVSGFWSSWDGWRHAIVALRDGKIWDVRYHPCCGVVPTLLVDLAGWGEIKSISAWPDPQRRTNVAFLTRWGAGNVLGVHQQGGGAPATTTYVSSYPSDSAIDVAGHHEVWNATSMVTVAIGAPSRLEQFSWRDDQSPDALHYIDPSTNTPWATRFPSPGQAQTIVSLTASDQWCYFCPQWGGVEQVDLLTTANRVMTYNVNNGGALLFHDWTFAYGPQVRSISGPFLSPASGGNTRRNTLVMMSNGDVWDLNPLLSSGAPSWTTRFIGTF